MRTFFTFWISPKSSPAKPATSAFFAGIFAGIFAISFALSLNAVAADSASTKAKTKTPPAPASAPAQVVIPNMDASGMFFANTLAVEVHFGRVPRSQGQGGVAGSGTGAGAAPDDAAAGGGKKSGKGGGGGFHVGGGAGGVGVGGGGGGSGRRGGGGEGRGGEGGGGGGGDLGDYSNDPLMRGVPGAGDRRMNIREERNPSTQLRLVLTNRGAAPLVIEVLDFTSILGDFAVKPDKITVAPGATVEAEPMISRLGIPTEDVPVKVRLRSDGTSGAGGTGGASGASGADGTSEQQTLVLKMPAGNSGAGQN